MSYNRRLIGEPFLREYQLRAFSQKVQSDDDRKKYVEGLATVLKSGGRLALADIVTDVRLPEGITCDATLWAACIGGAMQVGDYTSAIDAAGLRVTQVRDNPQYQFISKSAQGATREYGVKSVSLVATRD